MKQTQLKSDQNGSAEKSLESSLMGEDKSRITLITALNRLKQTEDRIYQAKKKLEIIHMRNTSMENRMLQRSRAEQYHEEARNFAEAQKKLKKSMMMRRSAQISKHHEKSMQQRIRHKRKLQEIQENIINEKRSRYEQTRKQREENKKSIDKNKNLNLMERKTNYTKMFEEDQKRKQYLKNYMKNKQLGAKLRKEEETMAVQSRIIEGEKEIENLKRMGSQASYANINFINPESPTPSLNGKEEGSVKNFAQKGFRVKYYKNQTTVLLE